MSSSFTSAEIASMEAHASQTRGPNLIACGVITLLFAYLVVGFRFLSHRIGGVAWGLDDSLILIALGLFTGFFASTMCMIRYGFGKHIIFITNEKGLVITLTISEFLYPLSILFIKMSILMLYRRIFPSKKFHALVWIVAFIVFGYTISSSLLSLLQCVPIASRWDTSISGTCIDYYAVVLFCGIMNIVSDFTLLGMPIPLITHLNMSTHRKIMLICVFGTGACACFVSIARCVEASSLHDSDSTYDEVGAFYASLVEIAFGIFSACVPTYKPLWSRISHHGDSRSHYPGAGGAGSYQKPVVPPMASFQSGGVMGERYSNYLRSGSHTTKGWSELSRGDSRGRDDVPLNGIGLARDWTVDRV